MWKYTLDTELMYRKFWLLCSSVLLRVVGFQRVNRRWEGNGYQIKHVKGTACLENCRWLVFLTCNECGGKWWKNMLGNPAHSHHSLPLCHASKENPTEVNCIHLQPQRSQCLPHSMFLTPRSVTKLCLTLCKPMDCGTPGFPVLHYLLEFAQTHVHWVGDAIQSSHPLPPPSPPALNLSQHQGLCQWLASLHHVAKVLEL